MASFPGSLASFAGFTSSHTLSADNHAAQHNLEQAEILAAQTKIGTGASTPILNTILRGTGAGTSSWAQVVLTTDVTGILPIANGGTGQANLTSLTLTTPIIADFSTSTHNHQNNSGGGLLSGASLTSTDGLLRTITYYTSNDTWSKQSDLKYIIVEVQAGGGGGGGAAGVGGQGGAGSGGGAGGYSRRKITTGSLASSVSVTVGGGGSGGTAGNNAGTDGGNSSFGALATASAGTAGGGGASSATDGISGAAQGSGGASASGDVNVTGQGGGKGFRLIQAGMGGRGGNSTLGIGGAEAASSADGNPGTGYGSGGAGGATNSATSKAGGNGMGGVVIVYEYY